MEQKFHIHLVSDATGETLNAIANAALAQFEGVDVQVHSYALVRSEHQLNRSNNQKTNNPKQKKGGLWSPLWAKWHSPLPAKL